MITLRLRRYRRIPYICLQNWQLAGNSWYDFTRVFSNFNSREDYCRSLNGVSEIKRFFIWSRFSSYLSFSLIFSNWVVSFNHFYIFAIPRHFPFSIFLLFPFYFFIYLFPFKCHCGSVNVLFHWRIKMVCQQSF